MSEKIYVEGKKKPGIGKILLYVLGGLLLLGLLGSMGKKDENKAVNNTDTNSTASVTSVKSVASKAPEKTEYAVGEGIKYGDITLKLNSVTNPYTPDNEFIQAKTGNNFVKVNVTLNNTSASKTVSYGSFDFKLQNSQGNIVDTTFAGTNDYLQSGQLAPGGTVTGDLYFEAPNGDTGLKLILDQVFTLQNKIYVKLQ